MKFGGSTTVHLHELWFCIHTSYTEISGGQGLSCTLQPWDIRGS